MPFCYSQAAWTAYLLRIAEASAPIRETQAQAEAARPISETQIETPTFSRSCHAAQGCRQSDCGRPAFALAATWSLRTDARPLSSARLRAESQPTRTQGPRAGLSTLWPQGGKRQARGALVRQGNRP